VTQDQTGQEPPSPRLDTTVAHPARIYDYWLGGKDNFQADREAAQVVIEHFPDIIKGVKMNRAFLGRAISYLAAQAGIRQFLDVGTGLPTGNNTHEVAQAAAPESRIVYVDNDRYKSGCAHARGRSGCLRRTRVRNSRRVPELISLSPTPSVAPGPAAVDVLPRSYPTLK
jgi:S-adenosyl methyltransferase